MTLKNSGIQTKRDSVNINFAKEQAESVLKDFKELEIDVLRNKYNLPKDGRDWTIEWAKSDAQNPVLIHREQYRPFDYRYSFYSGKSKGLVAYPRQIVSNHLIGKENHAICLMRQFFRIQTTLTFYTLRLWWMKELCTVIVAAHTYSLSTYTLKPTDNKPLYNQKKEHQISKLKL